MHGQLTPAAYPVEHSALLRQPGRLHRARGVAWLALYCSVSNAWLYLRRRKQGALARTARHGRQRLHIEGERGNNST